MKITRNWTATEVIFIYNQSYNSYYIIHGYGSRTYCFSGEITFRYAGFFFPTTNLTRFFFLSIFHHKRGGGESPLQFFFPRRITERDISAAAY